MTPADPEDPEAAFRSLSDAAANAWADGRVADAIGWFATLRQRFPARPEPFADAAALLSATGCAAEAAIVLAAARARFPADLSLAAAEAEVMAGQGRLCDSLDLWASLRAAHPTAPIGFLGAAAALLAHGAFDEAAALMEGACARFPDDPALWIGAARVAAARPDPVEAARRIAAARDRFPADPRLAALDGLEPALLEAPVLAEAVAGAIAGERWPLVADICRSLRARFPGQILGYAAGAEAAMASGELTAAAALLEAAERRHGPSPQLTLARARLAAAAGDWEEAISGFEVARTALPDDPAPVLGLVRSLRAAGHAEAARTALDLGLRQFPEAAELQAERGRRPERPAEIAAASPPTAPADPGAIRRLLDGFVSLGAEQGGGELARLRRRSGLADLGLLDAATLTPDALATLLETGFESVGADEATVLDTLAPEAAREDPAFGLADRSGTFVVRTGLSPASIHPAVALATGRAWLRAAAATLQAELRAGRRCFVYRLATGSLSRAALDRVRHAMGGRRLVLLCAPDATHPAGSVTREAGGVLVGRIPPLDFDEDPEASPILACWFEVLAALARDEVRRAVVVEERRNQLLETA